MKEEIGVQYIDCNFWVGKRSTPTVYDVHDLHESTGILKNLCIAGAFATHIASLEYSPSVGNEWILETCAASEFPLYPVWTLLPGFTGEFPGAEKLRQLLAEKNIRLVRMYPARQNHHFCLSDWCCGALFEVLQELKIPLMLDAGQLEWSELEAFLRSHRGLNVILSALTYRDDRCLYPLMETFDQLYLETSGIHGFLAIEALTARFGASRLVFGSNAPWCDAGSAYAVVALADISESQRAQIASQNILRLTGCL